MEASAEEVSTVGDLEVEVSMEEVSGVDSTAVALMRPLWPPDTLEAESAAAAAESALADRTFRVASRTLLAQDPGSHHLGDHHPGSQSIMADLIEP